MKPFEQPIHEEIATIRPRARVLAMPEYHPPLGNRDRLRLDFNENTVACSPKVKQVLESMSAESLTRYPEREPVEAFVAEKLGVKSSQVVLTNGVDEAISVLWQAFLDEGDELLLPVPTYTMYQIYAAATEATIRLVRGGSDFAFPFEQILDAVNPSTTIIAIANPNSPTGSIASREQILTIAKAAPGAIILIDEAYCHFYGHSVIDLVGHVPNLIVARTFSKAYGLAGLRVGLLAGPENLLHWVRRVLSPYSVNSIALACLTAALDDQEYLDFYVSQVKMARALFLEGLDRVGISYWPTEANFVLVNIGTSHHEFVSELRSAGILVRDRSADPGCDGCVRITIGTPEQMEKALRAIETFVEIRMQREKP